MTGSLLLLAAALKADGLSRGIFDASFLSSPQMLVAAIEAEIVIGCLLLWGRYARVAWLLAMSFFLLAGGVSFYVAVTGQRYCPACFGVVRVPSWGTCALDAAIVAVLTWCRPSRAAGLPWRGAVALGAGAAVVCGAFFALTTDRALAFLRGQRISVTPAVSDLGDGRAGEARTFEIRLTNHAATPMSVVGGSRSCGCDPTSDLPIALAPGESRSVRIRMGFAGSPGRFQRSLRLFTNDEAQPEVTARYRGRVVE